MRIAISGVVSLLMLLPLLTGCASMAPPPPATASPSWGELAELSTVVVVTLDPDGDERATTVWLVEVDGRGFIRTGGTRWFANLERDPELRLRAGGAEYSLRSVRIDDAELEARIDAAFRAKYGVSDRFVSLFRGRTTNRMRLDPR